MRVVGVVPLGLAALLSTGAALAQTNAPHTGPGRSGVTNAPVGANAAPGATPGAVTGLNDAARGGQTGTTVQGTPQGPSAITNAPVGAGSSSTAPQSTTRP